MFSINYKKQQNRDLLKFLEKSKIQLKEAQFYIPIYKKFFELNDGNYNSITLNQKFELMKIHNAETDGENVIFNESGDMSLKDYNNSYSCSVNDASNNSKDVNLFFKFSPLLDPIKYAIGKYEKDDEKVKTGELFTLPSLKNEGHTKVRDDNNSAYVDGMFTYLTSQLLHNHHFPHGLDYYGSFVGLKQNFVVDVVDEVEILFDSSHFEEKLGGDFHIDAEDKERLSFNETRNYKNRLKISDDKPSIVVSTIDDTMFEDVFENSKTDDEKKDNEKNNINEISLDELEVVDIGINDGEDNKKLKSKSKNTSASSSGSSSSRSCSSRSSNTSIDEDHSGDEDDDDEQGESNKKNKKHNKKYDSESESDIDSESESDNDIGSDIDSSDFDSDDESEDSIKMIINEFPVQMICLEKCDSTLDKVMTVDDPDIKEWESIFMQIIMMLITYQKTFDLTHNDLHTNNIMYVETEKQYLYYRYNGRHYKVPTYGKLYKLIDFGRAIYKFKGQLCCSDSFHPKGDAATQYNIEPYRNEKKDIVEPNPSFDLCRLACSMFDFFIDDMEDFKKVTQFEDPIAHLINDWCKDDKGRNILYKSNNEERYPDFKLYKMIARKVHNHTPQAQLERDMFKNFGVPKKKVSKKAKLIDIDAMPVYT